MNEAYHDKKRDAIRSLNTGKISSKEYKEQIDEWAINSSSNTTRRVKNQTTYSNYARILKMQKDFELGKKLEKKKDGEESSDDEILMKDIDH